MWNSCAKSSWSVWEQELCQAKFRKPSKIHQCSVWFNLLGIPPKLLIAQHASRLRVDSRWLAFHCRFCSLSKRFNFVSSDRSLIRRPREKYTRRTQASFGRRCAKRDSRRDAIRFDATGVHFMKSPNNAPSFPFERRHSVAFSVLLNGSTLYTMHDYLLVFELATRILLLWIQRIFVALLISVLLLKRSANICFTTLIRLRIRCVFSLNRLACSLWWVTGRISALSAVCFADACDCDEDSYLCSDKWLSHECGKRTWPKKVHKSTLKKHLSHDCVGLSR